MNRPEEPESRTAERNLLECPAMVEEEIGERFERFCKLIARLRAPGGCPWDREQTHESLRSMTIEEAYEVVEAIDEGGSEELAGELGDLLLQVVFHSDIAREAGRFDIVQVLDRVSEKMVRRHPHVFGDSPASDAKQVLRNWEAIKQQERAGDESTEPAPLLDAVSRAHPAVLEAYQLGTKASRVGFDWPDGESVLAKVQEEIDELNQAIDQHQRREAEDELGDLLFAAVNAARVLGIDPESALKAANRKFRRRFGVVEKQLHVRGRSLADAGIEEMEALWTEAKRGEG